MLASFRVANLTLWYWRIKRSVKGFIVQNRKRVKFAKIMMSLTFLKDPSDLTFYRCFVFCTFNFAQENTKKKTRTDAGQITAPSTMSLSALYSPQVSMSSDFSSSYGLAELLKEYEREDKRESSPRRIDENTPLTNGGKDNRLRLNMTLILTILVVTIGSSFQFGYATGEI